MENKTETLLKEQKELLYKIAVHLDNLNSGKYNAAIKKALTKK